MRKVNIRCSFDGIEQYQEFEKLTEGLSFALDFVFVDDSSLNTPVRPSPVLVEKRLLIKFYLEDPMGNKEILTASVEKDELFRYSLITKSGTPLALSNLQIGYRKKGTVELPDCLSDIKYKEINNG